MKNKIIYLATGKENDYFEFGVELNWLFELCKTFKELKFNTVEELENIFKGNWTLSERVFDIAHKQNRVIF